MVSNTQEKVRLLARLHLTLERRACQSLAVHSCSRHPLVLSLRWGAASAISWLLPIWADREGQRQFSWIPIHPSPPASKSFLLTLPFVSPFTQFLCFFHLILLNLRNLMRLRIIPSHFVQSPGTHRLWETQATAKDNLYQALSHCLRDWVYQLQPSGSQSQVLWIMLSSPWRVNMGCMTTEGWERCQLIHSRIWLLIFTERGRWGGRETNVRNINPLPPVDGNRNDLRYRPSNNNKAWNNFLRFFF